MIHRIIFVITILVFFSFCGISEKERNKIKEETKRELLSEFNKERNRIKEEAKKEIQAELEKEQEPKIIDKRIEIEKKLDDSRYRTDSGYSCNGRTVYTFCHHKEFEKLLMFTLYNPNMMDKIYKVILMDKESNREIGVKEVVVPSKGQISLSFSVDTFRIEADYDQGEYERHSRSLGCNPVGGVSKWNTESDTIDRLMKKEPEKYKINIVANKPKEA